MAATNKNDEGLMLWSVPFTGSSLRTNLQSGGASYRFWKLMVSSIWGFTSLVHESQATSNPNYRTENVEGQRAELASVSPPLLRCPENVLVLNYRVSSNVKKGRFCQGSIFFLTIEYCLSIQLPLRFWVCGFLDILWAQYMWWCLGDVCDLADIMWVKGAWEK